MPNTDADLQEVLKRWDAGEPVRVFTIATAADQTAVWGFAFALLASGKPDSADPLKLDPAGQETAREIVKAVKGHGWRKCLQIHIGQYMPAIEIRNPNAAGGA